jgi:hypothetical protein
MKTYHDFYKKELEPEEVAAFTEILKSILSQEPPYTLTGFNMESKENVDELSFPGGKQETILSHSEVTITITAIQTHRPQKVEEDLWQSYLDREENKQAQACPIDCKDWPVNCPICPVTNGVEWA